MKKSWVPFLSVLSIALVLAVAFAVIELKKGKSTTDTPTELAKFSKGSLKTGDDLTASGTDSPKTPEARNSKDHQRRFCRKCCQTPPCWYNNHQECSKCVNQKNMKLKLSRLLRRSHKKATHHHQRGKQRMEKHVLGKKTVKY